MPGQATFPATLKVTCKTKQALVDFIGVCERKGVGIHYPIFVEEDSEDSDDQQADIKIELERAKWS